VTLTLTVRQHELINPPGNFARNEIVVSNSCYRPSRAPAHGIIQSPGPNAWSAASWRLAYAPHNDVLSVIESDCQCDVAAARRRIERTQKQAGATFPDGFRLLLPQAEYRPPGIHLPAASTYHRSRGASAARTPSGVALVASLW
jgi:hypothetical protein